MRRIVARIEPITIWMVIGMCWVMLVVGAAAVGGLVLGIVFSSPGVGAPDWAHQAFSFGAVGLSVAGFLTLALYGVGCWLDAQLRRWATDQAIDLELPPAEQQERRRSRAKDG